MKVFVVSQSHFFEWNNNLLNDLYDVRYILTVNIF
jgi:hypothetical protein